MTAIRAQAAAETLTSTQSQSADLEGVLSFVELQLKQLSEMCGAPAGDLRPPGLSLDEVQRQRDALASAARALAEREAHLQAWHDRLESTQNRLATEHETVAGTLEQRRGELNSLDGSLRVRSAEVASRRESLAAREASLTAAEGEVAERERRLASLRSSLDRRSAELDAASARIEDRAASLAERARSLSHAESQADSRAAVITEHQTSLEDRSQAAAEREARAAETASLRAAVASLQARLDEATRSGASARAGQAESAPTEEVERLSRQRDSLARELSDRERLVEQLSADCLVLRADADAALSRAAEQDRQIRRLEGRVAELSGELSGQTGGLETQRSMLRAARSETTAAQHRLESFRAELDLRHEEITERSHELDLREAELERRQAAMDHAVLTTPPGGSSRPDIPGVTVVPSCGLVVPDVWFDWAAPRRRRFDTERSVRPGPRR